jgi:hypothetical protein
MKDTTITVQRKKKEILWLGISLVIAVLLNVYAIAYYHTTWKEMYTMVPTLLILAVVIYGILILLRLGVRGILRLTVKK